MRRLVGILSLVAVAAVARGAYAQQPAPEGQGAQPSDQDKALAATLFDEARALMAQDKVSPACRKLEESRRLDPLPGTVLNLAACH